MYLWLTKVLINGKYMILTEALIKGIAILKSFNITTPVSDAGVILCFVIKRDRSFLYTHGDFTMKESEESEYFEYISMRSSGMPLQYITGYQEFMSLDFKVAPGVLIPRQDTEILVETVMKYADCHTLSEDRGGMPLEILDMCTGSGCIAVSLAHYIKDSCITAVDISRDALEIAERNAFLNGVGHRVRFQWSNLFEGVKGKSFDIIVSNPPYIASEELETLQEEVKAHEPLIALDGGMDGLNYYRQIVEESVEALKTGGVLAFEVGHTQARSVASLMEGIFTHIKVVKDLGGIDRVVAGELQASENMF